MISGRLEQKSTISGGIKALVPNVAHVKNAVIGSEGDDWLAEVSVS